MNTNQLEHLIAIIDYRGIREAATHLYISPQALSKSISKLEQELGMKLFEKRGRGIVPTQSAVLLSELAQDIIESLSSLKDMILASKDQNGKQFVIGMALTPYHGGIPLHTDRFVVKNYESQIEVKIIKYTNSSCIEALREGLVDATIVASPIKDDRINYYKLASLPLGFIMDASNQLATRAQITLSDISTTTIAEPINLRCVYRRLRENLKNARCNPSIIPVAPYLDDYVGFLSEGGIMLVHSNSSLLQASKRIIFKADEIGLLPSVPYYYAYDRSIRNPCNSIVLRELRKVLKKQENPHDTHHKKVGGGGLDRHCSGTAREKEVIVPIVDDFMTTPIAMQNVVDLFEIIEVREKLCSILIALQLEPNERYLRIERADDLFPRKLHRNVRMLYKS